MNMLCALCSVSVQMAGFLYDAIPGLIFKAQRRDILYMAADFLGSKFPGFNFELM